jgi:hypothetical protein
MLGRKLGVPEVVRQGCHGVCWEVEYRYARRETVDCRLSLSCISASNIQAATVDAGPCFDSLENGRVMNVFP